MIKITVLICSHNRAPLLKRTLDWINRAHRPENCLIDILVVANACTDNTVELLESYQLEQAEQDWLPLGWLEEPTPGKSHALNRAILELHAELAAFVDDDHRVDEHYLTGICEAAKSYPEAGMFCGRILPDWDGSEPDWVHDKGPYRIYPLPVPRQDYGDTTRPVTSQDRIPGGGNLIIRREVFDRVGKFASHLGPRGHNLGGGEDTDFVLRALNIGEKLLYIPGIKQFHYVDPDRLRLRYLLVKSFQRSRAGMRTAHNKSIPPLYMWRKLAEYILQAVFSLSWRKKRFYLVRVAAVLGEMRGGQSNGHCT